jgi:superfamily I DNA and/or RNA helicase
VKGKDTSVAIDTFTGTDSWQNSDEADVAVEIVDALIQNGVAPIKIGVMSPFRGQVVAIRKRCRAKHYHDVNVGTIENFQGVEQDVIILSLTRSNPLFVENDMKRRMGVFGMPKQANVALTRAENLFIVIGNPESMWEDQLWRQWLLWAFRNGLWYGEGLQEWDSVKTEFKDAKFVSMLEEVDNESNVADSVVVSTIEKVHRVHSTNGV